MEIKNDQAVLELMVRGTLVSITSDAINNMTELNSTGDDDLYVEQYSLPTGQCAYSILGTANAYVKNGLPDPCKENKYLHRDSLVLVVGVTNHNLSARNKFDDKDENALTFIEAELNPYQVKIFPEESYEIEEGLLYDDEVPGLLIKRL